MPTVKTDAGGRTTGVASRANKTKQSNDLSTPSKKLYRLVGDLEPETSLVKTSSAWGIDKNGDRRLMRLAHGATTIWLDEQVAKGEKSLKVRPLSFNDGRLMVTKSDKMLDEFMERHAGNQKNGGASFYYYNPEEVAEKKVNHEEAVLEAKILVKSKLAEPNGLNKMLNIAKALDLDVKDNYSEIRLKEVLWDACEANPQKIERSFNDPLIKAKSYIEAAYTSKELVYDGSSVRWAGGKEILKVPQGRPWKEFLAQYATETKNIEFLKELDSVANGK